MYDACNTQRSQGDGCGAHSVRLAPSRVSPKAPWIADPSTGCVRYNDSHELKRAERCPPVRRTRDAVFAGRDWWIH